MRYCPCILIALCMAWNAAAFNEPVDQAGPLKAVLNVPDAMTEKDSSLSGSLLLHCDYASAEGNFTLRTIDGWQIEPSEKTDFFLNKGESREFPLSVTADPDSFNAIYPVHAYIDFKTEEGQFTLHPVQLIYTRFEAVPRPDSILPWQPFALKHSRTKLLAIPVHRMRVQAVGRAVTILPTGFSGTERATHAEILPYGVLSLPEPHETLFAHPPWKGGARGSVIREYYLNLPANSPIRFQSAVAIGKHNEGQEPPSDGVTFRVRLVPENAPEDAPGEILCETHTSSFVWQDLSCDLSAYAGQTVRLLLETHPGQNLDTTCDRGLWGDPEILINKTEEDELPYSSQKYLLGAITIEGHTSEVFFQPGRRGLLDGTMTFSGTGGEVSFQGFSVKVFGEELKENLGASTLAAVQIEDKNNGIRIRHSFQNPLGDFELIGDLSVPEGTALRVELRIGAAPSPKPWLICLLEQVETGPWNARAARVYAGMGNVICNPEAFTLAPDGHQLATSFVGFDFESGLSLVQALKAPPSRLKVSPKDRVYTLEAGVVADYHFLPAENVWAAVRAWRDINGLNAGRGVEQLAGRFTFDLWGGRYAPSQEALQRSFRYGLTNSVVIWHSWQRYGYDYRLPDITPANPNLGSLEEFQSLIRTCQEQGALFAPHDNYIDFYPDAEGFTYDAVAFQKNREPVWAWLNEGRGAQSFRWRPTAFRPFMEKNIRWVRDWLHPDAYFIDVWASLMPCDTWTQDGQLEDRMCCRKEWQSAFYWIQDALGGKAPMISESGHDQLVGYVDGAQANHLRVDADPPPGRDWGSTWRIRCSDAERIPWSDMAYHDRFVYQGAGYNPRYSAGWRQDLHGIFSDDYISTEMLTGHPAMTPAAFSRDGVRKYWLSNDFITRIALNPMEYHHFEDDDIHRQHIRYANGAQIWVNRGEKDWDIKGHVLPPFGFYAEAGDAACAIEKKQETLVEWSRAPERLYLNARRAPEACLPLQLLAADITSVGGRTIQLSLNWDLRAPLDPAMRIFVHFIDSKDNIAFQADHPFPAEAASEAKAFSTAAQAQLPPECQTGDHFEIRVGVFQPGKGQCLMEQAHHERRFIAAGTLVFEGEEGKLPRISYAKQVLETDHYYLRMNREGKAVSFEEAVTDGAFRLTREGARLILLPLPDSPAFDISLNLEALPFAAAKPGQITTEKQDGTRLHESLEESGTELSLHVAADTFALYLE